MSQDNLKGNSWKESIDVRDFVSSNMTSYDGDESFLSSISEKTQKVWDECTKLMKQEFENNGILDVDTKTISYIDAHNAGYIDKENEVVVGLQTDAPLKRAIKPLGGVRVVEAACAEANYKLDESVSTIFSKYRKTHNDGVFDIYTPMMRKLRTTGILTGLPDNYARGRIIGDYRRVALYGIDKLIEEKETEKNEILLGDMNDELMRLREEVSEQILALKLMNVMAQKYGCDISKPASNSKEAVQWTYFAYLAALKEHDGAAMSLGNVSNFFDIYFEEDMKKGELTEEGAQELVDQFVIKLRIVRHLRGDAYNKLFAGDPTWLTEAIGGMWKDGRHKISKTSYRFLQTLYNLGASPEPNLTILWAQELPEHFKKFSAKVSIETSSIQYENDDLMRKEFDCDDYGISCCVSQLSTGKKMQYFGARCNLAKALLLAINNGHDELKNLKVCEDVDELEGEVLDYDKVLINMEKTLAMLAREYVNTMNVIHYSHDKYYYERAQMALLDTYPKKVMAFGIAGLSVVADSLSAIKYAKVKTIRNEMGVSTGFKIEGDFPKYGNDDDKVDDIAAWLITRFDDELHKHHIYRNAEPTLSVLTITSNVIYGKKTGATPDGRLKGIPFAPGANPMHGRDENGAIASLNSVAKMPFKNSKDGISNTFSIVPSTLGSDKDEQVENLVTIMDGYFQNNAHHLNVNVLDREVLLDAMENPSKYPQLTIRVSGYAVNFIKLTKEQQEEVLSRTFFEKINA